MIAALKGHTEIVKILVKKGADVNRVTARNHYTALTVAVEWGRIAIVRRLIRNGAKYSDPRNLTIARSRNNPAMINFLMGEAHFLRLEYGELEEAVLKDPHLNLGQKNEKCETLLAVAMRYNRSKTVEKILDILSKRQASASQVVPEVKAERMLPAEIQARLQILPALLESMANTLEMQVGGLTSTFSLRFLCMNPKTRVSVLSFARVLRDLKDKPVSEIRKWVFLDHEASAELHPFVREKIASLRLFFNGGMGKENQFALEAAQAFVEAQEMLAPEALPHFGAEQSLAPFVVTMVG